MLTALALLLTAPTSPSAAFQACMDMAGGRSMDMLQCGRAEIARVDARMNLVYRRLLASMAKPAAARLRNEQRAWLRHHLAETRRLADDTSNGSMTFVESQRFELQDLGDRTRALEAMLPHRH